MTTGNDLDYDGWLLTQASQHRSAEATAVWHELRRLRAIEQRAHAIADRGQPEEGCEVARYILGED